MTIIFKEMIRDMVECYIDVVKSHQRKDRMEHLKIRIDRLRQQPTYDKPVEMCFKVTSEKFLGFIVRHRRIKIEPPNVKAIMELPLPKDLRELKGLQGNLAYIDRSILNLAIRYKSISTIKAYLTKPLFLASPIKGNFTLLLLIDLSYHYQP